MYKVNTVPGKYDEILLDDIEKDIANNKNQRVESFDIDQNANPENYIKQEDIERRRSLTDGAK